MDAATSPSTVLWPTDQRWHRSAGAALVATLLATLLIPAAGTALARIADAVTRAPAPAAPTALDPATAGTTLASLPMAWTANHGQTDAQVRFLARGLGYAAFLTDTEAVVTVSDRVVRLGFVGADPTPGLAAAGSSAGTVSSFAGTDPAAWESGSAATTAARYDDLWPGIDVEFTGTGEHLEWDYHVAAGADPSRAVVSLTGAEVTSVDGSTATLAVPGGELTARIPAVWQTRPDGTTVERSAEWRVHDGNRLAVAVAGWDPALPGVVDPTLDWSTYLGGTGTLPTARHGTQGLVVDDTGAIYLAGYAEVGGFGSSGTFPTTPGTYATPGSTFVAKLRPGGAGLVWSALFAAGVLGEQGLAVDGTGSVYLAGAVYAGGLATTAGAYDTTYNGGPADVFVMKLDPTGSSLAYSTYLGGSELDVGTAVAVDAAGNAVLTGYSRIESGPEPEVPYPGGQPVDGYDDVIFTRLNAAGSGLLASTLEGGPGFEQGTDVAVGPDGSAYVVGFTESSTMFPRCPGCVAQDALGGSTDAFVFRTGSDPRSTSGSFSFLGGLGEDVAHGVAVDADGAPYVTGYTRGTDFPTTPGAFDVTANGEADAFVTKLSPSLDRFAYSTYLGASGWDVGHDVAVDAAGHPHVVGETEDRVVDFPTTPGAFDRTHAGGDDAGPREAPNSDGFVAKLGNLGDSLAYSTLLGGSGNDHPRLVAIDGSGHAVVTGTTESADHPTTPGAMSRTAASPSPAFLTQLDTDGASLVVSTFLAGPGGDEIRAVGADATGIYVAGMASSAAFPLAGPPFDATYGGGNDAVTGFIAGDAFVAKLAPSGTALLHSTFLGGAEGDVVNDLAVGPGGRVWVTGTTDSTGFPVTTGAHDAALGGARDGFVTAIDPGLTGAASLAYSSYLGSTANDDGFAIAVDAGGKVYVHGDTSGADLPTTTGAFDTTYNGNIDAFLAKLDPTLAGTAALQYSTYLGGASLEDSFAFSTGGYGLAVDGAGRAYLTGETRSANFPTTVGAVDTTSNGLGDVYVSKVDTTLAGAASLVYSTYLGGSAVDVGTSIAVDPSGSAVVTGRTSSATFPTTTGAHDTTHNGGPDGFVAKLHPAGTGLSYSTYLGTVDGDEGTGVALDGAGSAWVTGRTNGAAFPTTAGALDATSNGGWDGYVAQLSLTGAALSYSTYVGGSGDDVIRQIALLGSRVVVAGTTGSADLPTTTGSFDPDHGAGGTAGFVTVLGDVTVTPTPVASVVSDFDGDGDTDVSVYRPSTGRWYVQAPASTVAFGASGDVPVAADYDGDGDADRAVFRRSTGRWYVDGVAGYTSLGADGDIPVPADWTAAPGAEAAVFRPSTGRWYVEGVAGSVAFGANGDIPVPGQWDADPATDMAIYRPSNARWYVHGAATSVQFGAAGDIPVPAQWDADPATDVAVFRPGSGRWYVEGIAGSVAWGTTGDVPVPGQWDADATADVAVYRPSAGRWYLHGGATTAFGANGDVPTMRRPTA